MTFLFPARQGHAGLGELATDSELQSGDVWELIDGRLGGETGEPASAAEGELFDLVGFRVDRLNYRPERIEDYEISRGETRRGQVYYMVRNPARNTYLRIGSQEKFLWDAMDGQHTIADIAVAFLATYRTFPMALIAQLMELLIQHGLLREAHTNVYAGVQRELLRRAQESRHWIVRAALVLIQLVLKGIGFLFGGRIATWRSVDRPVALLYRCGVRLLYSRPLVWLYPPICIAGLVAFAYALLTPHAAVTPGPKVFILTYLGLAATLITHESAHAFACKSYGRQVSMAGLSFYMGTFIAFVNTTDIWMDPERRHRIVVSWAGVYANLLIGSACSLILLAPVSPEWGVVLLGIAVFNFTMVLFNLNPLLQWDGYYILMDWLEIPCLRKKSFQFLRRGLWKRLRSRGRWNREERIFGVFGVLAGVWTVFVAVNVVVFLPERIYRLALQAWQAILALLSWIGIP